jgi:hypothetical protein
MTKQHIAGIIGVGILVGIGLLLVTRKGAQAPVVPTQKVFDAKNTSFTIDGVPVALVNGIAEQESAPGSASKIVTRYFGNNAVGDANGDGMEDEVFLVTQETGGSGIFYYAVVAMQTSTGYTTTNAFFLGDRIAPQPTEINTPGMEIRVNYAERKPGEPMTARPSQGVTKFLRITPEGVLGELTR